MNPRLVYYRVSKDRPFLAYRLAVELEEGTKIMAETDGRWIEGIYSLRRWPFDTEHYDPAAGILYADQFGEEKWSPILEGEQVRIIR